jgi:hypothetical protein
MAENPSKKEIEEIRGKFVDAPTLESKKKVKKVIKVHRSPWILRGIIIAVGVILIVEAVFVLQLRKESLRVIVSNPPPAVSYPTPEVYSEIAPQIATADAEDYLPEPTQIPLPPELEGVDISYDGGEE